jgi:hypothetical protein
MNAKSLKIAQEGANRRVSSGFYVGSRHRLACLRVEVPSAARCLRDHNLKPTCRHTGPMRPMPRDSLRLLLGDPLIGPSIQQIQRERATIQHLVMKPPQIELRPQLFLRALPQFAKL